MMCSWTSPTESSAISGTASSTSCVTRWKPRERLPSWICRCSHIAGSLEQTHIGPGRAGGSLGTALKQVGGEVPIEASVLALADAYEAMTASRPYRGPLEPAVASEELRRGAGRQFDQRVVDAFPRVV